MDRDRAIALMRDAVFQEGGGDWHAGAFTVMESVPEKLRPLVRAVSAASLVGRLSNDMDPADPAVTHWKRSAVEEIDHQAGLLADSEYRREVTA